MRPLPNSRITLSARFQSGFTLIELVAVIIILGVISVGSTLFIGQAVKGVTDTAERQQVASIAWVISEKVSRDLRRALPNSVRIASANGLVDNCIEFIPAIEGAYYRTVPLGIAGSTAVVIDFESFNSGLLTSRDRLAVFPRDNVESYSLDNPGSISSTISGLSAGATADTTELTFSSPFAFQSSSPQNRIYLVRDPIAYCFASGVLRRYTDYGYQNAFSFAALANPVVIATNMQSGRFSFDGSSLASVATVSVQTSFALGDSANISFDQEVQVRNVP